MEQEGGGVRRTSLLPSQYIGVFIRQARLKPHDVTPVNNNNTNSMDDLGDKCSEKMSIESYFLFCSASVNQSPSQ